MTATPQRAMVGGIYGICGIYGKVVVEDDHHEDGRKAYRAHCPEIEEATTWGDTREEAMRRIHELLGGLGLMRIERGHPIPTAIPFESFAAAVVLVTV